MKNLTKQDVTTFGVLVDYGCEVEIESSSDPNSDELSLAFFTTDFRLGVDINFCESLTNGVKRIIESEIPPEGTPNEDLTDEQKGMIQLLFEIEKAQKQHA